VREDDLFLPSEDDPLDDALPPKDRKPGQSEPFVKMPLWWAEAASKAVGSPATLVLVELLRVHWRTKSKTFPLPNARLRKQGVSRDVKRRVLHDLERAGLIAVDRPKSKSPVVTLVQL
jgi:hypothetical protein